jgi:hypothetical protein
MRRPQPQTKEDNMQPPSTKKPKQEDKPEHEQVRVPEGIPEETDS